jgi:hypothetical protein
MKIVLHVGPFKTGSTSIQRSLAAASTALMERGVIYFAPRPMANWSIVASYLTDEKLLKSNFRQHFGTPDAMRAWSRQNLADLRALGTRQDAELCIISSEHLSLITLPDAESLAKALAETFEEVSVACYIRDPVSLYPSGIQQKAKGGSIMRHLKTPEAFKYRARGSIETFCAAFGTGHVKVRNFDRENLTGGDVVQDFLAHLGVPGLTEVVPTVMKNESVPGAAVAWLLNFNETSPSADRRKKVLRKIDASDAVAALPKLRLQDPGMQSVLRSAAKADMDWINANFLTGQIPLQVGTEAGSNADETAGKLAWLEDWIMGYLTPEAQAVLEEATGERVTATGAAGARVGAKRGSAAR